MSVTTEKKRISKPNTKPVVDYVLAQRGKGRELSYDPTCDEMATRFCYLGAKEDELARCLGVSEAAIKKWMHSYPSFAAAVRAGRIEADAKVASSVFQRASGYSHTAEKIFLGKDGEIIRAEYTERFPPETNAARYWLNNRRPDLWRDTPVVMVQNNNTQIAPGADPVQIGKNYQQIMDAEE